MHIQLSDHFNYSKLLRFALPSIVMLIFTSVYGVVDGFFVSNYVGKTPFTAVNFIMPFLMILGSVGFMFGTGGGALIAKTMGEGKGEKAKNLFSLIVYTSVICGIVLAVLGLVFIRPFAAISFLRTLVFQIAAVLILPLFWKVDGIWVSIVAAEVMAVIVTLLFLRLKQKKYQY